MAVRYALTTVDNPYNPFDEYDAWYAWDLRLGYDSTSYLARIVTYSEELSDADQAEAVSQAIDEIIAENGPELYQKISRESVERV